MLAALGSTLSGPEEMTHCRLGATLSDAFAMEGISRLGSTEALGDAPAHLHLPPMHTAMGTCLYRISARSYLWEASCLLFNASDLYSECVLASTLRPYTCMELNRVLQSSLAIVSRSCCHERYKMVNRRSKTEA